MPCPGRRPGSHRAIARLDREPRPCRPGNPRPEPGAMTTTTVTPSTISHSRRAAVLAAVLAVLVAAIGPLSIAALRGLLPYDTVDNSVAIVENAAAHPGAENAVLWLSALALLTMPLALLV